MKKIMIIDDDPRTGQNIKKLLDGFEVSQPEFDEDIFEKIVNENPDIIIMEIILAKQNGVELSRIIRDANTKAKIIILTYARLNDRGKKDLDGIKISKILYKPVDSDELILAINSI